MRVSSITTYPAYPKAQIRSSNFSCLENNLTFKSVQLKNYPKEKFKKVLNSFNIFMAAAIAALLIFVAPKRYNEVAKQQGYVEPLQESFDSKEEALNYSISRIVEPLNSEEPREYSVNLDYYDYDVASERLGQKDSVSNYSLKYKIMDILRIKHPYISLHGHPADKFDDRVATQTFSFQDFNVFVNDNNRKESFVVNKDGQFCIFRKKQGFKPIPEEEMEHIKKDYEFCFRTSWANPINVVKNDEILHTFYDFQGMHAFWKRVADKYNFEYYTNFGVYEGVDAYLDYYYPNSRPPQAPTSHRNFKL